MLLVFLGLFAWILPQAQPGRAAAPAARVRIGVTIDGIVRVTPSHLTAVGIDVVTIDPRTFALSSLGQPVAMRVSGEADGRFDPGDAILFFGQRFRGPEMDQKYTAERVYWLDIGGTAGPRISDVDATPQGNLTPPADFATTVRAEQSNVWWTLHCLCLDTQDTWFWDRLQPIGAGAGVTRTFPYTVPNPAPGLPATLRLEEISRSEVPGHITTIGLNSALLSTETWNWKQRKVFTVTVPAGLMIDGINTVTVGALNQPATAAAAASTAVELPIALPEDDWLATTAGDPLRALRVAGATLDDIYVNYWEVDYRRLFQAWQGQLDFSAEAAGPQEFLTHGWSTAATAVWDISNPLQPKSLTGAQSEAGGSSLRFRADAAQGARFWLQQEASLKPPASLRLRPPTGLRAPTGGADAVIVTHTDLRPAAELLAEWHRGHGRRALVVDFQDVVDEFNEGIYHPKAVPAMLAWAQTHWVLPAPHYLTLFGDGHWNFKGNNPARYYAGPIMIPPYLAWADPWQGEVPSDTLYGDINGDKLPEIAVGRISVGRLDEAITVVNKIKAYDDGLRRTSWQKRAIFVADRDDPSAGDFPAVSDDVIQNNTPSDLQVQRIYLGQNGLDAVSTRAAISSAINTGAFMVQYTGHGAVPRWSRESIWHTTDVAGLTNTTQLPIVMTFNCLDGYFVQPSDPATFSDTLDAMAEVMQRKAGGGSVAAISPSGLGLTDDQLAFRKILLDVMFKDNVREIGEALRVAKNVYHAKNGPDYPIATEMLFGDPATRLPQQVIRTMYLPLLTRAD
ncbi:MAG: C25 family cysteine peptidase [Anaerolineae bacterium]|nr:C25 family cysteine peptidase [Anaerolineae bacterium]